MFPNSRFARAIPVAIFFTLLSFLSQAEEALREAKLTPEKGAVEILIQGQTWQLATGPAVLHEGDEVRVSEGGSATLDIEKSHIELSSKSHLKLDALKWHPDGGKQTLLNLAIGKVLIKAEKLRTGSSSFEVKTPTSTTGVRGTEFEVSVEEQ